MNAVMIVKSIVATIKQCTLRASAEYIVHVDGEPCMGGKKINLIRLKSQDSTIHSAL